MRYVLDTDVFIDYFRQVEKARMFMAKIKDNHIACFSAITQAELLSGDECDEEEIRDRVMDFMISFVIIPVDSDVAQLGGKLKRKFKIKLDDALIAATALKMKAKFITRNLKDFKKVEGLEIQSPY